MNARQVLKAAERYFCRVARVGAGRTNRSVADFVLFSLHVPFMERMELEAPIGRPALHSASICWTSPLPLIRFQDLR